MCEIGIGFFQSAKIEHKREVKFEIDQKIKIEALILDGKLALLNLLRGERYVPHARCPKCNRKLTSVEILKGFNSNPNDYTTCCSGCGHRFQPYLICFGEGTEVRLPFFCPCQTLAQMRGKEHMDPETFSVKEPAIYRAAIVHHGGLKNAFRAIGINYMFEEKLKWKDKIVPFLGKLPDKIIAETCQVSAATIGNLRKKLNISRFLKTKIAEA